MTLLRISVDADGWKMANGRLIDVTVAFSRETAGLFVLRFDNNSGIDRSSFGAQSKLW
jgi:hypothetical protein